MSQSQQGLPSRGRRQYRNFGSRGSAPTRPGGFRTRSQMRRDSVQENERAEHLIEELSRKGVPTPQQMERKQPKKENPQPEQPRVKLDHYTTEWIETDRNNITVELYERFEDLTIAEHIKHLAFNTDALQYEDVNHIRLLGLAYSAYCYTNIAYRLIMTLPSSARVGATDFLRELRDADQPRNTPAMAELTVHLGKSDVPNYGRLRIDSPILQARRRITRAISLVHDQYPFKDEFKFERDIEPTNQNLDWQTGVWGDYDSWKWIRNRAADYALNELKLVLGNDDLVAPPDGLDLNFSLPYYEIQTKTRDGLTLVQDPNDVVLYWSRIQYIKGTVHNRMIACLVFLSTSFNWYKEGNMRLYKDSEKWGGKNFAWQNSTSNDLLQYLGLTRMDKVCDDRLLRYNYFVITNNYKAAFENRVERVFDLIHLSKEEFGDESQAIQCVEDNLSSNPLINSQFQFRDKQKTAAGGLFRYAFRVKHRLAEEMIMKRTRMAMIAEIVSKFSKNKH